MIEKDVQLLDHAFSHMPRIKRISLMRTLELTFY